MAETPLIKEEGALDLRDDTKVKVSRMETFIDLDKV